MSTGLQILFFILVSPLWILGLVLWVDGWGRRARASVVGGWLMMAASIVPLGASLVLLPRPSIVTFGLVAAWRWRARRRTAEQPPPPTGPMTAVGPLPPERPPRPAVSGARYAMYYAFPLVVLASVVSEWSSLDRAAELHVFLSVFLVLPSVVYENSRPHRGAVLVIGEVVGHERYENDGSVSFSETVSFRSGTEMFSVQGESPKPKRPLGSSATVSYRPGEPAHSRVVPGDGARFSLVFVSAFVLICSVMLGWTSLPLLALIGVGHVHFIIKDRRRAERDGLVPPSGDGSTSFTTMLR